MARLASAPSRPAIRKEQKLRRGVYRYRAGSPSPGSGPQRESAGGAAPGALRAGLRPGEKRAQPRPGAGAGREGGGRACAAVGVAPPPIAARVVARQPRPRRGEGQGDGAGPAFSLCRSGSILRGESGWRGPPAAGDRAQPPGGRATSWLRGRDSAAAPWRGFLVPHRSALLARLRSPCSRPSRRSRGTTRSTRRTSSWCRTA